MAPKSNLGVNHIQYSSMESFFGITNCLITSKISEHERHCKLGHRKSVVIEYAQTTEETEYSSNANSSDFLKVSKLHIPDFEICVGGK